jgi:hypothetical protein
MIPKLARGSIETLLVDIEDVLGNLTDLSTTTPMFDVKDSSGNLKQNNVVVTVDPAEPMRAECLVNTTVGGLWTAGKYYLYVKYTANPDAPILGGMEFHVNP